MPDETASLTYAVVDAAERLVAKYAMEGRVVIRISLAQDACKRKTRGQRRQ